MFTVEMDLDEILITLLEDEAKCEDVSIFMYDDMVYLRQWVEKQQSFQVIQMSPEMFQEMLSSMQKPEGAYRTEYIYKK